MSGLKEILKLAEDGTSLSIWQSNVISALETFLTNIHAHMQQKQLPLSSLVISYSPENNIDSLALLLNYCFTQIGIPVTLSPLSDDTQLKIQLSNATCAVVLCTPQYAAKVGKGSVTWNVLDKFGKTKKNALHPLLCTGEFRAVALQIVASHYLTRSFHAVLNLDPLRAIPALVDIVFHLSGSQGLGLLPDVLNLKETVNASAEALYQQSLQQLQTTIQKHTIDYRLKVSLEAQIQNHPLIKYQERPVIDSTVKEFLSSSAKVGLLFCQNKADTAITSLSLSEILIQSSYRILTIDCGKYPGQAAWDCVKKALKTLKLKTFDIEVMKNEQLIIVLNNYEDLGAYDNLWVKNSLSSWMDVKLLVTCRADFFKQRGYLRCFLADVSNRKIEDITVFSVPAFASEEAQKTSLSITVTPEKDPDAEQFPVSAKRQAEYVELTRFLERIHLLWVEKDFIKSALHQNPKLFISYAWEEDKNALARQQMYLTRIAFDLKTLGFPTWLDMEQMSGNIDEQMDKNIADSDAVLIIETPRYIERAQQSTNVKKEWDAISVKIQQQTTFKVFLIEFLSGVVSPLNNHAQRCDFTHIDEDYVSRMTHPETGLIPRLLCDTEEKKGLYQSAHAAFEQDLRLLIAKHLIVNQDQKDVLAFDMDNRLKGHITSYGLYTEDSPMESRFDLRKYFEEFLNNAECKTSIVLGRAGSGKSLFALSTFKNFLASWITYQISNAERPIWLPIFIQLRNYSQHSETAIQDALKRQFHLSDADITALKQGLNHQQQILFILDGYDELGSGIRPNFSDILKDWPLAKLLITSRPEHFDKDHRPLDTLSLKSADGRRLNNSVQEIYVSPFSSDEIEQYVKQYGGISSADVYQTLKNLPGMLALLDNPFLLILVLQSLPQLLANRQSSQKNNIVRSDIYDAFTQTWFLQETKGRDLNPKTCETFSQELAFLLFAARSISITSTSEKDEVWDFFNSQENQAQQDASPIRFSGGEYSFIHKSLYEYFTAKFLWNTIFEGDCRLSWQTRLLTEERPLIDFLSELYQASISTEKEYKLMELIEGSRDPQFPAIASSNAMTVLNSAKVSFSGKDLRNIRISAADLTGAILDNTNLAKADLSYVNFTGGWLHGTDLTDALLTGFTLGEYPSLSFEEKRGLRDYPIICYSRDGYLLAIIQHCDIHLYDGRTLVHLTTLEASCDVDSIAISSDNTLLASSSSGIRLWDIKTGQLQQSLKEGGQFSVAFSPDGILFASGCGVIELWDVKKWEVSKRLKGQISAIKGIVFSSDSSLLIAWEILKGVELWNVKTGELLRTIKSESWNIAINPDNSLLASAPGRDNVELWNVNTGELQILKGHTAAVFSVAFSPDGNLLASGSRDHSVKLWNMKTRKLQHTFVGHTHDVWSVVFSPDSNILASGSKDFSVQLWDMKKRGMQQTLQPQTLDVRGVAIDPNGSFVVSASKQDGIKLWDIKTGQLQQTLTNNSYESIALSSDGSVLAASNLNSVELWDVKTGKLLYRLKSKAWDIAISPDSNILASGSEDANVTLWDIKTGELQQTLKDDSTMVLMGGLSVSVRAQSLAFSPDGNLLALGNDDASVKFWDIKRGVQKQRRKGHLNEILCVAFNPDGNLLASGSLDSDIKLWYVNKVGLQQTLGAHTRGVTSIAFSPDGKLLASGSYDNNLILWELGETSSEICHWVSLRSHVLSLVFRKTTSGEILLISGHGDSVKCWQLITVEEKPYLQLKWSTFQNVLLCQEAKIAGAQGLSAHDAELLKQRGAIGEPLLNNNTFNTSIEAAESNSITNTTDTNDNIDISASSDLILFSHAAKKATVNRESTSNDDSRKFNVDSIQVGEQEKSSHSLSNDNLKAKTSEQKKKKCLMM